ncbi:MAG: GNAT family N-acetyltransferase, partial [Kangiellaceae bacterium]|nr:GNAT family N-acetyltransferase [Kangiellaceae bacterium]
EQLVELLDNYAKDPMGGGEPLSPEVKNNLITELKNYPQLLSVIAYYDDKPAGLINCVLGFSTFKCKPLLNIHDVTVNPEFRGKGIARKLLQAAQDIAIDKGCCKLTLEVLEGNQVAKQAYLNFGFKGYELDPKMGQALFWEKSL